MGKKDEYRFNLRFDETDEMHRLVVKYLNSCGHNKAKYIVRAFLAYGRRRPYTVICDGQQQISSVDF